MRATYAANSRTCSARCQIDIRRDRSSGGTSVAAHVPRPCVLAMQRRSEKDTPPRLNADPMLWNVDVRLAPKAAIQGGSVSLLKDFVAVRFALDGRVLSGILWIF